MTDKVVFAQHEAPYVDPGAQGQTRVTDGVGSEKHTYAPDEVVPGTPPASGTHSGTNKGDGERAASLFDREEFKRLELEERHRETVEGNADNQDEPANLTM